MVDETQDISGKEQESIVIRFIDDDLQPIELFYGLYEIKLKSMYPTRWTVRLK